MTTDIRQQKDPKVRRQFWTWAVSFTVLCLAIGWFAGKATDSLWWFLPALVLLGLAAVGGYWAKKREYI
jgi:hypothetical protein